MTREQAATRYLEASVGAGATGLPAEHREARQSIMTDLERRVPGTRRRAIAGTRRHFDRPLSAGEREHQAHLRREEGLSMGDVDRIGAEELDAPASRAGSPGGRSPSVGARRAGRSARRALRSASSGGRSGSTLTYMIGIGLVLVLVYLFVRAKPGGGLSGPQIFTAALAAITGAISNFLAAADPISSAEAKLGAAPLATPPAPGGGAAPGGHPPGLLSALFPKGTTYAVSRTDAGKDFSNIGGAIGALEAGTVTAVHQYSGFGTTIFQRLAQPIAGKNYAYYALENGGALKVKTGQAVNAGTPLATGTGGVIEVGLSSTPDVSGIEQGGKQESGGTPSGLAFASALGLH